ncbi:hypothetical protein ACO2Q8_28985 [Larkinella sp. VNQ87]|uniref:hypothetical protein n=1 Tax=Larkinella sp. VNQ87 TaxID=3400921 RepID=UPI003BFD35F3
MKTVLTTFWLAILVSPAFAQGTADYYRPSSGLTEEPGSERHSAKNRRTELTQLVARYGQAYIRERWYVGMDGFFRSDQGQLSQTFNGLISTQATTKSGWSALIGWVGDERWAVEGGYARSPIHNTLLVGSGTSALDLRFTNDKHGFLVRGKRRLQFGKQTGKSGLWLGAGFWIVPNNGQELSQFMIEGYSYSGFGGSFRPSSRPQVDTIQILGDTRLSPKLSGLAEASAEYTVKLGGRFDLSLFARKYWGLGNSITTNLDYRVNGGESQTAVLRGNGSGWSVGISLRYVYALRYDLKTMPRIFNLRGNRQNIL